MRAVVQRVTRAQVSVDEGVLTKIAHGLCVLLGVGADDTADDAAYMAEKIVGLRIFRDDGVLRDPRGDKMNRCVQDVHGAVLLISQFTLHGDVRKGRRPSFITAARPDVALPLYEAVGVNIERCGIAVAYGSFGATMEVELINDGPVTILLDSKRLF